MNWKVKNNVWSNWLKHDGWARLTDYVVGVGVGLIVAAAIAGSHAGAQKLLIIIGCVLVVIPLLVYVLCRGRK